MLFINSKYTPFINNAILPELKKKRKFLYRSFLRLWFTWCMIYRWPNWRFFQGLSSERNPTSVALFVQELYSNEGAWVKISVCKKREERGCFGMKMMEWLHRHGQSGFNSSYVWVPQCLWSTDCDWFWKKTFKIIMDLSENQRRKFLKYMSLLHGYFSASTWFWWPKLLDIVKHGISNKPNQLA